jgi:hypothetical protein
VTYVTVGMPVLPARRISVSLIASFSLCACGDAAGSLEGGQALPLPTSSARGASFGGSGADTGDSGSASSVVADAAPPAATWTTLYALYFGNPMTGGCGAFPGSCHQAAGDSGAKVPPSSGFVCGATQDACYQGMLNATPPLISTTRYVADPTTAPLYQAVYQGGLFGSASNNMPLTANFVFSPADMSLIATWMKDGAPNN